MRVRTLVFLLHCIGALLFCGPATASAQEDETPAYREAIEQAVAEFDATRFAEARALFLRAHAISPNARTLRGIGMASFEMSDYVESHRTLTASLAEQRRALTGAQRDDVQALLRRTANFLGFYRVEVTPSSATYTIDGEPPVLGEDGRALVAMGSHRLVVSAEGYRDATTTLRVQGGEERELTFELEPSTGRARVVRQRRRERPQRAADVRPDPLPGIVVLSVGGAAALGSVAVGVASWMTREEQITICTAAGPDCENPDELRSERDTAATITVSLAALGIAGIIIGSILVADAAGETAVSLACGPHGIGIGCRGRF